MGYLLKVMGLGGNEAGILTLGSLTPKPALSRPQGPTASQMSSVARETKAQAQRGGVVCPWPRYCKWQNQDQNSVSSSSHAWKSCVDPPWECGSWHSQFCVTKKNHRLTQRGGLPRPGHLSVPPASLPRTSADPTFPSLPSPISPQKPPSTC